MSRTALVLLAVAVLVSLTQWTVTRVSTHVDQRFIPVRNRRRVARLVAHPAYLQLVCGLTAALAAAGELAVVLG